MKVLKTTKPEKQKKVKPSYSVWQNSIYVLKNALQKDKSVVLVIVAQILLTVGASVVALFLPRTVITLIASGVKPSTLILTVLAFTVATVLLQSLKVYLDMTAGSRRISLRVGVCSDILKKTIKTDYSNLDEKKFTDLKQKAHDITNNNSASTEAIYSCFSNLGINLLGFIIYLVLLVSVNPLILLITAATTVATAYFRNRANIWEHKHDTESADINKKLWYINERGADFTLAKDIRLFGMADWLKELYASYMKLSFDWQRRVETKQLLADISNCFMTFAREGVAYAYLLWLAFNSGLATADFVLLFSAISGFSGWILGILQHYSDLLRHSLAYCRLREFLDFPEKFTRDGGELTDLHPNLPYSLELRNVSFRYAGSETDILKNINLTIASGERLAVVGLNGAGKTTLVKLLCGLYDPTEGSVLLDGEDIRKYDRRQYYRLFTAVFQEFNILPVSIAQNISQQISSQYDEEKLNHCLALAELTDKIHSLPVGAQSLLVKSVNEDAVELSGGETQRLMLARALYKEAPILVLDEPTAALDPIAESHLYNRYNELAKDRTSIYISHRLASTRFCDRIILIDNGVVAESGTHAELVMAGGKYNELFEIQIKYYKENDGGEI